MNPLPSRRSDLNDQLAKLVEQGLFQDVLDRYYGATATPGFTEPKNQLLAATAANRLGRVVQAHPLAEAANAGFRERHDAHGQLRSANLLGVIAFEQGRLADADAAFGLALRLAETTGDQLMAARIWNNVASVAHLRGDDQAALEAYRRALDTYRTLGNDRGIAETQHNLGLRLRQLGAYAEARVAVDEATQHAAAVGDPSLDALILIGSAELELAERDWALAAADLDRAAELATTAGNVLRIADVAKLKAVLALETGNAERARHQASVGATVAASQCHELIRMECTAVKARALRRLGRTAEAEASRTKVESGFRALGAAPLAARFVATWAKR
ncbi:MAG: tetratricopeptide repeat protein [Gemmatimonadales bacterium]